MNGWFALGILAVLSLAVLVWNVRSSRGLWQIAAAVVLLGMTGYALQGRPTTPSSPAKPLAASEAAAIELVDIRADMDQSFGSECRWAFSLCWYWL